MDAKNVNGTTEADRLTVAFVVWVAGLYTANVRIICRLF